MSLIRIRALSTFASKPRFQQQTTNNTASFENSPNLDEFTQHEEDIKNKQETDRKRFDKDENIRHKILNAALTFVPECGWTKEAIEKGVEKAELPKVSSGIIGNGPIDLVHHLYEQSNLKLGKKSLLVTKYYRDTESRNAMRYSISFCLVILPRISSHS